ncbi:MULTISPECIES: hypothetical protein [Arthrobacter]|uniref:Uncharacterized protein n=1 Tax=Arthrobacter terricola TaxID=2547396 RepID=A0A4R5KPE9_9MICC|nr:MULTISPECIES: hypothetical protein [Arthrobacter]MBT8160982.1 hypothetical protein [Arthrobacter sp. GN70]TDF96845.1 hypothetical protein E1809_08975 [Arthrobacter terricola]
MSTYFPDDGNCLQIQSETETLFSLDITPDNEAHVQYDPKDWHKIAKIVGLAYSHFPDDLKEKEQPTVLSINTLHVFADMLNNTQIPVGHPDFEQSALGLIAAKKELAAAIQAASESEPSTPQEGTAQGTPAPSA